MLILTVLLVLFFGGIVFARLGDGIDWIEIPSIVIGITAGILLLAALMGLPLCRLDVYADIEQFGAVKNTVENARFRGDDFENATLQHKVIEANAWLAKTKYYNTTIFEIWIPDEVNDLSPIK